jgi:hypothetical protein
MLFSNITMHLGYLRAEMMICNPLTTLMDWEQTILGSSHDTESYKINYVQQDNVELAGA